MFLKLIPVSSTNQRVIVNISSLYATQPCAYWGTYCMTKAARDQLIGVIALEEVMTKTHIFDCYLRSDSIVDDLLLKRFWGVFFIRKAIIQKHSTTRLVH